jgi:hypothetical protein
MSQQKRQRELRKKEKAEEKRAKRHGLSNERDAQHTSPVNIMTASDQQPVGLDGGASERPEDDGQV